MAIVGRYVTEAEFYKGLGGQAAVESIESDEGVLNTGLSHAEDQFDSFVIKRYFLPESIEETPNEVKRIVTILAKYAIKSLPINAVVPDTLQINYDKMIAYLEQVRLAKPESPSVIGLVERRKITEVRASTPQLDPFRQPVQSGRLDLLRPIDDRRARGSHFAHHSFHCPIEWWTH